MPTLDFQVGLYQAEPRRPALTAAVDQVKATDPDIPKFAAAAKGGVILPAIPAMGQVWAPFGVAEAAIVGGADPATALKAAAMAIRAGITAVNCPAATAGRSGRSVRRDRPVPSMAIGADAPRSDVRADVRRSQR